MSSKEYNSGQFHQRSTEIETSFTASLLPFLVKLIVTRRQVALFNDMIDSYGAPSYDESGWLRAGLMPMTQAWDTGTPLTEIRASLSNLFRQEREAENKSNGMFAETADYAQDVLLTLAHFGGERGPLIRYTTNTRIPEYLQEHRINSMVEMMSISILRGFEQDSIHNNQAALKSIRRTLNSIMVFADDTHWNLATFAKRIIDTTLWGDNTLL